MESGIAFRASAIRDLKVSVKTWLPTIMPGRHRAALGETGGSLNWTYDYTNQLIKTKSATPTDPQTHT